MELITCAHYGEAQTLIESYHLKKQENDLFCGENFDVLITGEGRMDTCVKTSLALGKKKYDRIINLGIAGALRSDFKIGEIHRIRTIYGENQFKSFTDPEGEKDLISALERVKSLGEFSGLADLVDREAWSVAYCAKEAKIDFICYKVVSDHLLESCEAIRKNQDELSMKIYESHQKIIPLCKNPIEFNTPFYMTFSQKQRFLKLNEISTKKYHITFDQSESFKKINSDEIKLTPKEKTQLFLDDWEAELFPLEAKVKSSLLCWLKKHQSEFLKIKPDTKLESEILTIEMKIKNHEDLQLASEAILKLNIEEFHRIMSGSDYVE